MKHCNIPIFVPHMGCPHDCVFCSQKKITGVCDGIKPEEAEKIIKEHLKSLDGSCKAEIAFFGGSFTGIPSEIRLPLLKLAKKYIDSGDVLGIRLSTRPDYISKEILDELLIYGVTSIELGVQSLDDEVLIKSGRGHTKEQVFEAVSLIQEYPFELGLQMMTGLPSDTPEKSINTAKLIAKLKPKTVRVYPTLVIRDTYLEKMMNQGEYIPWSIEKTVDTLAQIKKIFDEAGVTIIRMGLQTTDEINPNASVVGGPFHPSIGELAESRLFLEKLEEKLVGIQDAEVFVTCSNRDVSKIAGHGGVNKAKLKKEKNIILRFNINEKYTGGYFDIYEVRKFVIKEVRTTRI